MNKKENRQVDNKLETTAVQSSNDVREVHILVDGSLKK